MKLKINEYLVYPGHGIGRISKLETKNILGKETKFALIELVNSGMKIMFPIENMKTLNVRKISDNKTAKIALEIMNDNKSLNSYKTWNKGYKESIEKIKSGELIQLAEVYRNIKNLDKELSFGERKMLDTVKTLLYTEIGCINEQ